MHVYYAVMTFLCLVVGAFLHTWVLASNCVKAKNGVTTYKQYIEIYAAPIAFRFALAWCLFGIYVANSVPICAWASQFDSLGWLKAHPIHPNPEIALLYGLFVDSFLSSIVALVGRWVPGFNPDLPPAPAGNLGGK